MSVCKCLKVKWQDIKRGDVYHHATGNNRCTVDDWYVAILTHAQYGASEWGGQNNIICIDVVPTDLMRRAYRTPSPDTDDDASTRILYRVPPERLAAM